MGSLAPERDALWKRLEAASFLTTDEKRAAAGYDAQGGEGQSIRPFDHGVKFNPYHDEIGRFTTADSASVPGARDGRVRVAQAENERDRSSILARFPEATPAQEARWAIAND